MDTAFEFGETSTREASGLIETEGTHRSNIPTSRQESFRRRCGHLQESSTQREVGILDPKGGFPGSPDALRDDYDASITAHHAPSRMNMENRLWVPSVSNKPLAGKDITQ